MTLAAGAYGQLRIGTEVTWNTAVAAGGTSRIVRRKTCDLSTKKESFQSAEMRSDFQYADMRHGLISSSGTLTAEPSPGAHADLFAAVFRKVWATGATTGALTDVVAAAPGTMTFTQTAGDYFTMGFKVGDVVRWTGWATTGVANNSRNYIISALTAKIMTCVDPGSTTGTGGAKAAGDSVTCSATGKKLIVPSTAHTDKSFTVERWHSDVAQSMVFTGVKVGATSLKLTTGAMGDLSFALMGSGYSNTTAAYFSAATAASTTSVLAGSNGGMMISGSTIAYVRDLSVNLDPQMTPVGVIGSNAIQGILPGSVKVTGSITALFQDAVMRDYFLNESTPSIVYYAMTGTSVTADFIQICMPYVKFTSADIGDGPGVVPVVMGFQALLNPSGGVTTSSETTTISMQDSLGA